MLQVSNACKSSGYLHKRCVGERARERDGRGERGRGRLTDICPFIFQTAFTSIHPSIHLPSPFPEYPKALHPHLLHTSCAARHLNHHFFTCVESEGHNASSSFAAPCLAPCHLEEATPVSHVNEHNLRPRRQIFAERGLGMFFSPPPESVFVPLFSRIRFCSLVRDRANQACETPFDFRLPVVPCTSGSAERIRSRS